MYTDLLQKFVDDLKVEGVKLQLQVSCVNIKDQNNPILGKITAGEIDSHSTMETFKKEFHAIQQAQTPQELSFLVKHWFEDRVRIQYEGYGWGDERAKRAGQAYCFVFLTRMIKQHKELFDLVETKKEGQ